MNLKEFSKNNVDRRYCDVTSIKAENIDIESFPIKKLQKSWIAILGVIAVVLGFLLMNFNAQRFLLVLGFALLFVVLFVLGNKFSVHCDYSGIKVKQHFQTITIQNKDVKNVYIAPTIHGIISTYVLVISCEDKLNLIRDFEFPLLCVDKEEAIKFVENFVIAGESDQDKIALDKKRSFKRIVGFLFRLTCAIIIAAYLIIMGVIPMPH